MKNEMELNVKKRLYTVSVVGERVSAWRDSYRHEHYQLLAIDSGHAMHKAMDYFKENHPSFNIFSVRACDIDMEWMKAVVENELNEN